MEAPRCDGAQVKNPILADEAFYVARAHRSREGTGGCEGENALGSSGELGCFFLEQVNVECLHLIGRFMQGEFDIQ